MVEGGIGLSAVLCDLCENEPAQSFCRTCSGNLCDKCTTEHKSKKIFFRHDVVKMTLTRQIEKDGYGYCSQHPESKYELCCHECTMPVCTKCIAGVHNGHKMTDISSAYIEAKGKITSKVERMETSHYAKQRKQLDDLDNILNDINKRTNNVEQAVLSRSKELADLVHEIEKEVLQKISKEKEDAFKLILSYKEEITEHLSSLRTLQNMMLQERDSKCMTDLILYTKNNLEVSSDEKKFLKFDLTPSVLNVTKQFPDELRHLFGLYLPSTMVVKGRKQIMKSAKEVARFKSAIQHPIGLACSPLNVDLTWIRGDEAEIKKVDIQGNEKATVKTLTKLGRPSGLIELDDESIFFSDLDNKMVKRLSKDLQEEATMRFDWYPMGLCISRSGHILLCAAFLPWQATDASDRGKVLRMSFKGVTLQEIMKDGEEKHLYCRPICISENINQDICVSDVYKHSIVVVDRTGLFRFVYSGGGFYENREDFEPTEIDTDSLGNIAAADVMNNLVHLVDINGNLLKYLLTTKDGISEPRGLKVDNEDRIWITEEMSGYVKIFKYLE
ncbi:E3 ubiquitin-protein ligase TRIM71-like [Saccostrea cucullata]|uniref:E3 ubiquitin-protein ligase TRIM71-like n=1 Tax=Saccostrea cuccullata TaxID=36930 RepID=UPI002ED1EA74